MHIEKSILAKAASEVRGDVGSLRDLPLELRETIASLYYEHWWIKLSQEPSTGHPSWTEHVVTRSGLYEMVPDLVKTMREIRRKDESIFQMTVGTTLDLLRYNLKNVTGKSAARRAMEKVLRKPFVEIPGVYALIEQAWASTGEQDESIATESETVSQTSPDLDDEGAQPDLKFISELPHPQHNRVERAFTVGQLQIKYYRNPRSFGEIVAGIPTLYTYREVAVVESKNEPVLVVRTEQGPGGETYFCSVTSDGHRSNYGLADSGTESFLERVVEVAARFERKSETRP